MRQRTINQCSVDDCLKQSKVVTKRLCAMHYARFRRHGDTLYTERERHNSTTTPEYLVWANIVQRCTNPANPSYSSYGERDITICDEWRKSFVLFFKYVGARPALNYSLNRIDNDKGYEVGNVEWSDIYDQNANRRKNSNNTSGYRGVTYNKHLRKKWVAQISKDHRNIVLGGFATTIEAAYARDQVVMQLQGKYARLNFEYI